MKKLILTTILMSCAVVAGHAQVVLYSFGESTSLVTANQNIRNVDGSDAANTDINRSFSTNLMSPDDPDYTGPDFFGGWETSGGVG